jgi:hypothetical protein
MAEQPTQPHSSSTSYPPAPWQMVGQLWLSLFKLGSPVDDLRPAGVYGAAFVSYEPGSPLTYSELLVARAVPVPGQHGRRVSITDIWVDSPASVDFELDTVRRGPLSTTDWAAAFGRRPIASATFTDVSRAMARLPFKGSTWQPGIADTDGQERSAVLQGSSKALPCRGRWDFAADGPLGWLRGARQLASFRMAHFRMSFG